MAAFISTRHAFEFGTDIVMSPLTTYLVDKAYPTPHRSNFLVLSIVDAIVRRSIMIIGPKIADLLTEKAGYKDKGKITNHKFFQLNAVFLTALSCFLPIFYRFVGQKLNLKLPDYLLTLAYLNLNARASWIVLFTVSAFSPSLLNAK
jgi:hypothetical protein